MTVVLYSVQCCTTVLLFIMPKSQISASYEDLESPNYSDEDSDDPEVEVDDVDEQVTKIMRDPPIKLVAMQPPPSISMICDTRPVYRLKSSQILGFKNLFLPSSYLITC